MRIPFFAAILFFLVINVGFAQPHDNGTILRWPAKFKRPVIDDTDLVIEGPFYEGRWKVLSVVGGGHTYSQPDSNSQLTSHSVDFLDPFYAVDARNGFMRIVKDEEPQGFNLSVSVMDYGWIHIENLLIWQHCLNTVNNVNRKAMILNTIQSIKDKVSLDETSFEFRDGPYPRAKPTGKIARLFDIFYVLKQSEDNRYYLLSDRPLIPFIESMQITDNMKNAIWGWISVELATPWDHRVALEPNWEEAAKRERRQKGKIAFFNGEREAYEFSQGNTTNIDPILVQDPIDIDSARLEEGRPIGEWRRFPVLRISSRYENIFLAGVMGEVHSFVRGENVDISNPYAEAEIQKGITDAVTKLKNVNVVFVVDGTLSMNLYFESIRKAINKSILEMEHRWKNEFRFGGVVYRDFKEKESEWRRTYPLNLGNRQCADWFSGKEYHKDDTDQPEALFYGIDGALSLFDQEHIGQLNILIIIGDAGNRRNYQGDSIRVEMEQLVEKAAKYNCDILAIQFHNDSRYETYKDFTKQIIKLIENTHMSRQREKEKDDPDYKEHKWEINHLSNEIEHKLAFGKISGDVYEMEPNKVMNCNALDDHIVRFIGGINESNDLIEEAFEEVKKGRPIKVVLEEMREKASETAQVFMYETRILEKLGIDKDVYELLKDRERFQLYTPLYTAEKPVGYTYPLFKNVLFMSGEELEDMVRTMEAVVVPKTGLVSEQRVALYYAALDILESYFGEDFEAIESSTLDNLINYITGALPSRTMGIIGQVKIKEIQDPKAFPDPLVIKWSERVHASYDQLYDIKRSKKFLRSFESHGSKFYWIDEEILP